MVLLLAHFVNGGSDPLQVITSFKNFPLGGYFLARSSGFEPETFGLVAYPSLPDWLSTTSDNPPLETHFEERARQDSNL